MIYQEVKNMINDAGGQIMFEDVLIIKRSPHILSVIIYGCRVDGANQLQVNCSGDWHTVEDNDAAKEVVGSLYQRLSFLKLKTA